MIARLLLDTNINKNAAGAEENFACIFMRQRKTKPHAWRRTAWQNVIDYFPRAVFCGTVVSLS